MNNQHNLDCYQYKNCWIEIFLDFDEEGDRVLYSASIELPDQGGVLDTQTYPTREEAKLSAAQLIDNANYAHDC